MPIKVEDPRDIQGSVEDRFNQLNQAENSSSDPYAQAGVDQAEAFANDPDNATDSVRDHEQAGAGKDANWAVNRDAGAGSTEKSFGGIGARMRMIAKKGGPFGVILTVLVGGAGFAGFFGGPGLLLVNLAEVLTNRFDYQTTTLDVRHRVKIKAQLSGTTEGCSKLSFKCKFSTFSDKEVANFEKAGIKTNSEKTTITGRNKVTSFEFEGKTITAKDFASTIKNDANFSNAMHNAYNMKFLSKWDSIWSKVESRFKISKKAPFEKNATDEDRAKAIKEDTKNGRSDTKASATCDNPDKCSEEQKKAANDSEQAKSTADALTEGGSSEESKASQVLDDLKTGGSSVGSTAANFLSVLGIGSDACQVVSLVNTASAVAKTLKLAQMIRYAMVFLTTASMIKAGTATPEDVAYLGTILTLVVKDSNGNLSKSATESFGYRFAAFGDTNMDERASMAVAGSSFGGKLESAMSTVYSVIPGGKSGVKGTCKFLANPVVQAGSIAAGVAGLFFGVTETKVVVQAAAKAALALAVGIVAPFIAAEIGEILAGVLNVPYAEDSGNVISSATDGLLGTAAGYGGNAILHKDQAVAFLQLNDEVAASYAAYDRSTHSPFDISNPNTFMGSIFTQFAPYVYSGSSPMAVMGSFASILTSTAKNLVSPKAAADKSWLDICQDPQYASEADGGYDIATTPMCNPIRGIPPQYLDGSPIDVQTRLQDKGLVDDEGKPTSSGEVGDTGMNYQEYIAECMQRETAFGLEDAETDNTEECFITNQDIADAYIHAIDNRLVDLSEGNITSAAGTAMNTDSLSSFYAIGATQ